MAFLLGMSEIVKGQKYEINQDTVTIGRSGDNDFVLDHNAVSSSHCLIERIGNNYTLRDQGSTNGTLVNNELVTETKLKKGDVIQFGDA
ncbi:MAG: FHA domain-containing protein, partial [Lentisphaerae bacterium]|nr:FHA domain-containing protein [Lentisphaerota bacterium]